MGVIYDAATRLLSRTPSQPEEQKSFRTRPTATPEASALVTSIDRGKAGKGNALLYRNWAQNGEWIRAAINIRRDQVASAEWDIVPYDPDEKMDPKLAQEFGDLLTSPNPLIQSWRAFIGPIIEDLIVLDAGVIEKERTLAGDLCGLYPVDGAKVYVSTIWDGEPGEYRYFYRPVANNSTVEIPFLNEDMVYMMANPATNRVVGLSPLETLKLAIDAELSGSSYNTRQVQNAAPDGIFDLGELARPEHVERFRSYWAAEVAGRGALAFIGGTRGAKFIPFRSSNRDMQYLEWMTYLVKKVAAVMGMDPMDLGLTAEINKATAQVKDQQTEDRGLRPLLANTQDFLTREVGWDRTYWVRGKRPNMAFRFTRLNIKESLQKAQINQIALGGMPWKAVNEARRDDGRQPLGDPNDESNPFNKVMANTPRGLVIVENVPDATDILTTGPEPASTPDSKDGKPSGTADSGSSKKRPKD
jgi:HK97 family phage portal protein